MSDASVIRLRPFFYIHMLDANLGSTRVEVGPKTVTRAENEKLINGPEPMVSIPPRHYVVIVNPVQRDAEGRPLLDRHGNAKLRHGDEEIRMAEQWPEPFPLYPGEKLPGKVTPLQVVLPLSALRLRCSRDFEEVAADGSGKKTRRAGDEWLFPGPGTYRPRVEVAIAEVMRALIIQPNTAIKLRARKACVDWKGAQRKAGEEWLVEEAGAYMSGVDEEVVGPVQAIVLTPKKALHLRATRTFTDYYGVVRKAGEEWLVKHTMAPTHLPNVYETVVAAEVKITTLSKRQYAVVCDPWDKNGKPALGSKKLIRGPESFFLNPGERLEKGTQDVPILSEGQTLLLSAKEEFQDGQVKRAPGDRWMVIGPCEYVPSVSVEIVDRRNAIPLDDNEGVYIRDVLKGKVRAQIGKTVMLEPHEELWEKELPPVVEELLAKERGDFGEYVRDRTRVVQYRAPYNTAVQIYDYKEKKTRVIFGPDLVTLLPDEHFSVLSLSGDKPKRPHVIKALALQLGPDFMTDIVTVETSDHARLSLKLSYNWHFDVDRTNQAEAAKVFQVPDFVGDACKAIASRVRGAVALESFDNFHKNSARLIRTAVFGLDEQGKVNPGFRFNANNLVITNIDIQSVEPVDQRTRDSLQKSVQLAIEITTKSQEADARHAAENRNQTARSALDRQKLMDEADLERLKKELLEIQGQSALIEASGQAMAEAKSRADAGEVEASMNVTLARLRSEAAKIKAEAELAMVTNKQKAELEHQSSLDSLELVKAKQLADIEALKFKATVDAIGPKTIQAIAQAGPEMQAKLLSGLGIKSVLLTDGSSPINLFSTAQGLIAQPPARQ